MKQLSNEELAVFSGQLAMILHSGISVLEGISILKEDAPSEDGQTILEMVYEHLEETGELAEALRKPGVYPEYFIHMSEIGDRSGTLEEVMDSLARHYEREEAISRSIRDALTYPLVMLGMLFAVLTVLLIQVMPVFRQVFEQLGLEMSGIANTVFALGQILVRYSSLLLILFLGALLCVFILLRTNTGKDTIMKYIEKIPFVRTISELLSCSRFSSAMAISLHSGLDLDESFELAADLVEHPAFRSKIQETKKYIEEAEEFPEALRKAGIYSGLNARMLSIGFRTGSSETALDKIASSCQEEADTRIQNTVSAIEPTMVAVLSILTGMILLSVMLPLLGIMSSIG